MKYVLIKALLIAGTALDSHSSWIAMSRPGFREGNPILSSDGRYRAKGLAINCAVTGAVLAIGTWRERRHPKEKPAIAAVEVAIAGVHIAAAAHNYHLLATE